jgi:hypothetical protein
MKCKLAAIFILAGVLLAAGSLAFAHHGNLA